MGYKNLDEWFRVMIDSGAFSDTMIHKVAYDILEERIKVEPVKPEDFYKHDGPTLDLAPTDYTRTK